MAKQVDAVIQNVRGRILSGQLEPGRRLTEVPISAELGVSRTPVRLAFEELEKEGLVERLPTRGFKVRAFEVDEIADAINVRGVLEGMAARLAVERGLTPAVLEQMRACVAEGHAVVCSMRDSGRHLVDTSWVAVNERFHRLLVDSARNAALSAALENVARRPLASAAAMGFDRSQQQRELHFLQRAQQDHADVVSALENGQASRAEALMREHAFRSSEVKRKVLLARSPKRLD
jgi:GntR family transcriptional regulator, vanillate catabolism transcriptional regulator